jgi:hypothetical protein
MPHLSLRAIHAKKGARWDAGASRQRGIAGQFSTLRASLELGLYLSSSSSA